MHKYLRDNISQNNRRINPDEENNPMHTGIGPTISNKNGREKSGSSKHSYKIKGLNSAQINKDHVIPFNKIFGNK